jgi:hypothetical protein
MVDPLPRILLKSMALVYFRTLTLSSKTRSMTFNTLLDQRSRFTSGLRRFHPLLPSRVFCTRSSGSEATRPPQINNFHPLQDFGLREFQLLYTHFLLEHFTRSPRFNDACPPTDRCLLATSTIRTSGVSNFCTLVPPGVISPKDNGFLPHVPLDLKVQIHFISSGFRSFNSFTLIPLVVLSPKYSDLLTCTLLTTDSQDLLWVFFDSSLSLTTNFQSGLTLELWILRHLSLLMMNGPQSLRDFGLVYAL